MDIFFSPVHLVLSIITSHATLKSTLGTFAAYSTSENLSVVIAGTLVGTVAAPAAPAAPAAVVAFLPLLAGWTKPIGYG